MSDATRGPADDRHRSVMSSDPARRRHRHGFLERRLERFARDLLFTSSERPPRQRPATYEPSERTGRPARNIVVAYLLAVLVPTALAVLLIPLRADHAGTAALVIVVPVVAIAGPRCDRPCHRRSARGRPELPSAAHRALLPVEDRRRR